MYRVLCREKTSFSMKKSGPNWRRKDLNGPRLHSQLATAQLKVFELDSMDKSEMKRRLRGWDNQRWISDEKQIKYLDLSKL